MEVGKLIVNAVMSKAHITVSVKPFGCMPSSGVSDGVQSLITSRYPGTIFCAVETSGDGATNFYSRVQMYMFKARLVAEAELVRALESEGLTVDEVKAFLDAHPEYASPLHKAPHRVAGSAADLVYEVAPLIKKTWAERTNDTVARTWRAAVGGLRATPRRVSRVAEIARSPEFQERVGADWDLVRDLVGGKVKERFGPLIRRLAHRAITDHDPVEHVESAQASQRRRGATVQTRERRGSILPQWGILPRCRERQTGALTSRAATLPTEPRRIRALSFRHLGGPRLASHCGMRARFAVITTIAVIVCGTSARADSLTIGTLEAGTWEAAIAELQRDRTSEGRSLHVHVDGSDGRVGCADYRLTLDAFGAAAFALGTCEPTTGATEVRLVHRSALFAHGDIVAHPISPALTAERTQRVTAQGGSSEAGVLTHLVR